MELKHYLSMLRRWWWLLATATLLAAVVSYVTSAQLPRVYSATTVLLVGQALKNPNPQAGDFATSERLAQTYVQMVRYQPLLQAAADALGLQVPWQTIARQVSARAVPGTQLIQISVTGTDPRVAALLADEVARQLVLQSPAALDKDKEEQQRRDFANQQAVALQARIKEAEKELKRLDEHLAWETSARTIQELLNQMTAIQQKISGWQATYAGLTDAVRGGRTNNLTIVETAVASSTPVSPNVPRNVGVAAGISLLLAIGGVLIIEYFDDTLKTTEDVQRVVRLPLLGAIAPIEPAHRPADPGENGASMRPINAQVAEAYRIVRTNLQFAGIRDSGRVLLVARAIPGEGKTTTACNLAITMAEGGKRVILCDADLRQPGVNEFFQLPNERGLSDLLLDDTLPLDTVLVQSPVSKLTVLPSGPLDTNPADLFSSDAMARRVGQLRDRADVVILDSPAALAVADAAILGTLCDAAILVVDSKRTRSALVRQIKAALDHGKVKTIGVVLTKASGQLPGYQRYYRYRNAVDETKPRPWWRRTASALGRTGHSGSAQRAPVPMTMAAAETAAPVEAALAQSFPRT